MNGPPSKLKLIIVLNGGNLYVKDVEIIIIKTKNNKQKIYLVLIVSNFLEKPPVFPIVH